MDDRSFEQADGVWRALADPTRRALLDLLRHGPRATGELAAACAPLTRFAVMKHLDVLASAGLVISKKQGRRRMHALNAVPLRRVYERWVSRYEDQWAGGLLRLARSAERAQHKGDAGMATKLLDRPMRVALVEVGIEIDAPRGECYRAFIEDIQEWFYESEEARTTRRTVLEPRVGGLFLIEHDSGDRNLIAWVTMLKKDKEIRLRGDCTVPHAFVANMTVRFEDSGVGTRVSVEHRMAGEFDDDLPSAFDEGWGDGLAKLKALLER